MPIDYEYRTDALDGELLRVEVEYNTLHGHCTTFTNFEHTDAKRMVTKVLSNYSQVVFLTSPRNENSWKELIRDEVNRTVHTISMDETGSVERRYVDIMRTCRSNNEEMLVVVEYVKSNPRFRAQLQESAWQRRHLRCTFLFFFEDCIPSYFAPRFFHSERIVSITIVKRKESDPSAQTTSMQPFYQKLRMDQALLTYQNSPEDIYYTFI